MHARGIRMFFSAQWGENQCKIFHLNNRYGTVCNWYITVSHTSTTQKPLVENLCIPFSMGLTWMNFEFEFQSAK
jgi:hypothetical protein